MHPHRRSSLPVGRILLPGFRIIPGPTLARSHRPVSVQSGGEYAPNAEFSGVPSDGIGELGAVTDQTIPDANQHERGLFIDRLVWHEPHRRAAHRLAQRLGVGGVVLASLHVRLDQLRRNKLHLMPERCQQSGPMVGTAAGFDGDHGRRTGGKEIDHLLAAHLLAQNRLLGGVYTVQLKDML